jgi:hypothetical protein
MSFRLGQTMSGSSSATQVNIKPRLCLTVGVTGHRESKLVGVDLARISLAIEQTFALLHRALKTVGEHHQAAFSNQTEQLRLVSALADGADTLFAKSAIAAGWQVDACLPFARDQYAKDFSTPAQHDEFVSLLDQVTSTFELPGSRADATAAYEAVGRLVLEQCDVLVALWDGVSNRGRGGTSRVVAEAVARHIPVIHIHSLTHHRVILMWSGLSDAEIEQPSIDTVPRARAENALTQTVAALTVPPEHKVDTRMLMQFYRERAANSTPALTYPLLLAIAGVRSLSFGDFRPVQAETSSANLRALLSRCNVINTPQLNTKVVNNHFTENLIHRYGVADTAAAYFAQIFRSGFVGNFTLAAIAVVLALSGLLAPDLKLPIISGELICVILILMNTHSGKRFGWHERWMDNRHVAEQLRALALTSVLGDLGLRGQSSQKIRDVAAVPGWVGWLSRATARETGLPNIKADAIYLSCVQKMALHLISEQIVYQTTNAARMHKLEHRLHRTGQILFGGTVVACTAWIFVKLTGTPVSAVGKVGMTEIVTFLTAVLPALGASIYGIRMQGDFAGIAFRSQVTVNRLERLNRAMTTDTLDFARLSARLRNLADIMLADLSTWRTTYQTRPLALPG